MVQLELTWNDVRDLAENTLQDITSYFKKQGKGKISEVNVWPVPNGGIWAGMALEQTAYYWKHLLEKISDTNYIAINIVENPKHAHCFVDDIVDSGETMSSTRKNHGDKPFFSLVDKSTENIPGWVSFPWERHSTNQSQGIETNITRILQFIGEDPKREGLADTPKRVAKSWSELYSGYNVKPESVLTTFEDGACDEMVILKDIEFYSTCEHHMLPFHGKAHIGYIPNGKVVGISKLARLLEVFTRRLQIQERITEQVTTAMDGILRPLGSACVLKSSHFCMKCRGVMQPNSTMITSSLTGYFRTKPEARNEFLTMIND